jgi:hypothetical protein
LPDPRRDPLLQAIKVDAKLNWGGPSDLAPIDALGGARVDAPMI